MFIFHVISQVDLSAESLPTFRAVDVGFFQMKSSNVFVQLNLGLGLEFAPVTTDVFLSLFVHVLDVGML